MMKVTRFQLFGSKSGFVNKLKAENNNINTLLTYDFSRFKMQNDIAGWA